MNSFDYWFLPIASIAVFLAFVGFNVAAFGSGDWRWLLGSVICYILLAAK